METYYGNGRNALDFHIAHRLGEVLPGGTTCVLPVKLEAGKSYAIWLNRAQHQNFQDEAGRKAVPYLLVFGTK